MFDKQQKLEVTADELAVIEAALHTQAKILNMQADAGGNAARRRLNEVNRTIDHINRQSEDKASARTHRFFRWFAGTRKTS